MVKFIAADADTRKVIAVAPTEEQAMLWAEARNPESAVVLLHDAKSYSILTDAELRELLYNTTGAKVEGGTLSQLKEYISARLQSLPADPTPAEKILEIIAAKSGNACNEAQAKSTPIRRAAGGVTAAVWQIADQCSQQYADVSIPELRKIIIDKCVENGINFSTASTQYARWKKSQGY